MNIRPYSVGPFMHPQIFKICRMQQACFLYREFDRSERSKIQLGPVERHFSQMQHPPSLCSILDSAIRLVSCYGGDYSGGDLLYWDFMGFGLFGCDTLWGRDLMDSILIVNHTFWESDLVVCRRYETDVLAPVVLTRDVVSDYH